MAKQQLNQTQINNINTKALSTTQVSLLIVVIIISSKFQRLSAIVAEDFKQNGWIILCTFLLIDIVFFAIIIYVLISHQNQTIFEILQQKLGKWITKFLSLLCAVYCFFKLNITYKGVHEFFANTLFDKLPWNLYSILLTLLLGYLVYKGLRILGRTSELYGFLIIGCLVISLLLGFGDAKFTNLLPIANNLFTKTHFLKAISITPWFGDYFILLYFIGQTKINKNTTIMISASYIGTSLLTILIYIIFYAINANLSVFQTHTLSSITQNALLGLGIGKPDWFLVFFVMISCIISSGTYAYACTLNLKYICPKINHLYYTIVVLVLTYITDVYLLIDVSKGIGFFKNYACYLMLALNIIIPLLTIICGFKSNSLKLNNLKNPPSQAPAQQKEKYKPRSAI